VRDPLNSGSFFLVTDAAAAAAFPSWGAAPENRRAGAWGS
jgi:hypothetical protein